MTEPDTDNPTPGDELDDPGRDPKGLDPPRNLFGGGPDQDSGRGQPRDTGDTGPADKPGPPTEDPETPGDSSDEPAED